MKYRSDEERLKLYRDSLAFAWGFVDYNDWPVKLNSIFHLFLEEFGSEFIEDLDYAENTLGLSLKEIGQKFYNPARIYRLIDSIIYSMRRKMVPLGKQREITLKLLDVVKSMKHGSEFNENGRNIILNPLQVEEIVELKFKGKECSVEDARLIHRFCGIMWAYTEAVFFRAHDVTKEIHGPYLTNSKHSNILVREYLNLNQTSLWPDMPLLPCNSIKIYMSYKGSINITIDALNHLYNKGGSFISSLKSFHVEVDGKETGPDKLTKMIKAVENTILAIPKKVEQLSWHDKVLKYGEIFWFRKKPLRELRQLPCELPDMVRKKILAGNTNPRRMHTLTEEQVVRLANLTI